MVYEWVITIPSISFPKLRRISRQCVKYFVRYLKEEDANKKETTIAFIHFLRLLLYMVLRAYLVLLAHVTSSHFSCFYDVHTKPVLKRSILVAYISLSIMNGI